MKMLLDENLPKRLKRDFIDYEVYTAREKGWNGMKNGELIQNMLEEQFQLLVTFDKNLEYQQNFQKYPIAVFVLYAEDNTYPTLSRLVSTIRQEIIEGLKIGVTVIRS